MSLGCITVAACYDLFNAGTTAINIGVSIYLLDLACIALVGIALLHLARYPSTFPLDAYPCIALFVLLALNFARGVALYGPKEAGNMSRNLFFFVAPALALMLLRPVLSLHAERLVNLVVWSGLCLTAVALLRWTHVLPVISETWDGFREVPRVLPSDYAIPVGLAFIAAGYRAMAERKGSIWWMTAGLLGGVTLALQHRSVWVATILGFAWLVLRTLRRMSPLRLAGIALSGILGLGIITVATPKMLNTVDTLLTSNIRETEKSDSTWEWRVRGYDEAYERLLHSDLTDILVGPPAGVVDNSGGSYASRHIHSRYVDTFANYGIVGLVTLLLWFTLLWRRLRSAHAAAKGKRRVDASVCLEALFIAEVIYLIPYFGGVAEGSFLGLLWVAAQRREVATLAQVSRARGYLFRSRQDAFGRRSGDDWVKQSGLQGR
jgi:hypothetical protein